jgi:hypothetical protein
LYDDNDVTRLALTWRTPDWGPFWLRPTFGLQFVEEADRVWTNGSLTAGVNLDQIKLTAGGKFGDEFRPAYLTLPAVYNLAGQIEWGLWAGVRVPAGQVASVRAGWEFYRESQQGSRPFEANAHLVTIGLALANR